MRIHLLLIPILTNKYCITLKAYNFRIGSLNTRLAKWL